MNVSPRNLIQLTTPSVEPLALADAQAQCRVDASMTEDNAYLSSLIVAARVHCERLSRRAFITRQFQLRLDGFVPSSPLALGTAYSLERPYGQVWGLIPLPKPPLISVDQITYLDTDGDRVTLDPSLYQVESGGILQGTIGPAYGLAWPPCRFQMGSVRVNYTAGYGPDASFVPVVVKQAMLLCVAHWYRFREAVGDARLVEIPLGVNALLASVSFGSYA